MNPNLAGWTELPENLSSLFRTITMIVPDSLIIAKTMLYQFGFTHADTLGDNICAVFNFAKEKLWNETHYELGLRAIKVVLQSCANLKLKASGIEELGIRFIHDYEDLNVQQ